MTGRTCAVYLGKVRVGRLVEGQDLRVAFLFDAEYRAQADRPVLGQLFEDDLERTYWGSKPGRLPGFFENLLPEGPLRALLQSALSVEEGDELSLLLALSPDLPGAVALHPTGELTDLTPAGHEERTVPDGEPVFRFSLGGMQLKFSMSREGDRLTMPVSGRGGDWIVKIGTGGYDGVVENEHAMLEWASEAGFEVPERAIVEREALHDIQRHVPEGARGLAVRRYDRDAGHRIHQEDFAQVVGCPPTPSGRKYDFRADTLLTVIRGIIGEEGYDEALRRLVLVVAVGNADAHLKNWSLIYPDGVTAQLSPLYDQVCTVAWPGEDRHMAMKIGNSREFGDMTMALFRWTVERSGGDAEKADGIVLEMLTRLQQAWPAVQPRIQMLPRHRDALREHWQRVPLLRERGGLEV